MKKNLLIEILQSFTNDSDVIGMTCRPVKVVGLNDGKILISEEREIETVQPTPLSVLDELETYFKALQGRTGFNLQISVEGPTELKAVYSNGKLYSSVSRTTFGETKCAVPPPDIYGKTQDDCRARFDNVPNFQYVGGPRGPAEYKDWSAYTAAKDAFDDRAYFKSEMPPTGGALVTEQKIVIAVYLDDGLVFEYDVKTHESAREHSAAIVATGYRHSSPETPNELTHYPPHRVRKVKVTGSGITTKYYDRTRGT